MKKATFFAAALLMGAAVCTTPLQTMAASSRQVVNIKNICVGNASNINTEALKEYLENCNWGNMQVITIPCLPGKPQLPEVELPEKPEIETPEQEAPEQDVHAYVLRIVELVNEERAKAGLNPVTLKEDVTAAAQVRAMESEISFSHTRPNGTSFASALKEAGVSYRGAGENIAWGQKSPEEVMRGWMNSAGHRANILNERFTAIGVGYHQNNKGVNYWSQLFIY